MRALVLVDVQNDFMPFGSLPVRDGDAVVTVANQLARAFEFVVATQDWHPADHASFASNHPGSVPGDLVKIAGIDSVLWPDHCVQNSPGASFHSGLDVGAVNAVIRKGDDPTIDSYSGFFDNDHQRDTGLAGMLRARDVDGIVLVGLATDYCVRFTALDGLRLGFDVAVVVDGVRAVDLHPGDGAQALDQMQSRGCHLVTSADLLGEEALG